MTKFENYFNNKDLDKKTIEKYLKIIENLCIEFEDIGLHPYNYVNDMLCIAEYFGVELCYPLITGEKAEKIVFEKLKSKIENMEYDYNYDNDTETLIDWKELSDFVYDIHRNSEDIYYYYYKTDSNSVMGVSQLGEVDINNIRKNLLEKIIEIVDNEQGRVGTLLPTTEKMKYKMNITITYNDIETTIDLDCNFFIIKENDYGNKYHLSITNKLGFNEWVDIRYDTTFDINKKEKYLVDWAYNYWTGKNGAWGIKRIKVIKL
ncbi:MAG: hypothetical protein IJD91_03315 [Clostridia bacterium]|nr:hypothetical protein [Clostridia bacterium]